MRPMSRLSALSLLVIAAACGRQGSTSATNEAWNHSNDPLNIGASYERHLAALPTEGELATTPWSDTYWPSQQAGISDRWQVAGDPFAYTAPGAIKLRLMSLAERARLSPAEKFDAYTGRYDYPLVKRERGRTSPANASWEGICHGWSPAAINFAEPKPVLAKGRFGLEIPFGSSDIKALLSYYQGEISGAPAHMLGSRCNADLTADPAAASRPECRDTNAGAFHLVVANQLGLLKQGFVADVTRDAQVWNQPVHGFTSKVLGMHAPTAGAAPGTVQEADIETEMRYTVEVYPNWNALNGTAGRADDHKVYQYRVELDAQGAIIGGEWLSDDRPDFLWTQDRPAFTGQFKDLAALYELSLTGPLLPEPR